jgi:uncharacterized protein YcbX
MTTSRPDPVPPAELGPVAGRRVGRVAELRRYPVKSMAAEPLGEVDVFRNGLAGDRRWAFVREGTSRNGFPWLTLRQRPDLNHYRPQVLEPLRPDRSRTVVHTPSGAEFDVIDPELAVEFGPGVRVLKQDRGIFDWLPLSLITRQSVAGISALAGAELDVLRFRPNLVIDTDTGAGAGAGAGRRLGRDEVDPRFPEDGWVGRTLQIGQSLVRVDQRDTRCVIAATDPVTGVRDASILRTIFSARGGGLGVYGSIVRPGRVAVGDDVHVLGEP